MSCIVLIGGLIGCGKSTLINYFEGNKKELFGITNDEKNYHRNGSLNKDPALKYNRILKLIIDDICSIEEQAALMKTMKGWRHFRVDLLMASEYFISAACGSDCKIAGPLSERSQVLLNKLIKLNDPFSGVSDTVLLVEDNFYYRSMRYDWFQIARRANIGFCEVFLQCSLSTALHRNSTRGYQIPEQKIKMMMSSIEYPNPAKYKWEKFSTVFDSSPVLQCCLLKEVVGVIEEAAKNPAEMIIMKDKIESQTVCSKSAVHQADIILRKIISRKIASFKENGASKEDLQFMISSATHVRQELLNGIRHGSTYFSQDVLEKIQTLGIQSVKNVYEDTLSELFENALHETTDLNCRLAGIKIKDFYIRA